MARGSMDVGRITAALEQGRDERQEMRTDIKEIRIGFADLRVVLSEIRQTMLSFNHRTEELEDGMGGKEGLKARVLLLEERIKGHEEVIGGFKRLAWRIGGVALVAALSGGFGGELLHRWLPLD